MAKLSLKAGSTSQTVELFIQDSSSTTGAGLTGLVFNSAGLVAYYSFRRGAATAITLATLASATAAWSSGGFKEIDATNKPGCYRCDIPDAVLASGNGPYINILLKGATNMAPLPLEIELTGWDNQDAAAGGLSRLDAAISSRMATFTLPTNFSALAIDASGRIDLGKWIGTAPNALIQGRIDALQEIENGTAQAGAAASITLRSGASATDNLYTAGGGIWCVILAGTGAGQTRLGTAYTGLSKVLTITPNWTTNPDLTSVYALIPVGRIDLALWLGAALNALMSGRVEANAQVVGDKTGYSLSAAAVQAIWDALSSALTTAGSIGKRLVDFLTGDIYSRLGAPAGASLSADIAAVKAKTDNLPASPAAIGSAMTLTTGERDACADALLDRTNAIEAGLTPRQVMRLGASADAGKVSGMTTTAVKVRDLADSKDRISATVDADGNRTVVIRDLT